MKDLVLKFNLLDAFHQQEVMDFLDFLLLKKRNKEREAINNFDWDNYKKELLNMPVWTAEELEIFSENRKHINEWKTPEW